MIISYQSGAVVNQSWTFQTQHTVDVGHNNVSDWWNEHKTKKS